ncbi:MAG TPA: MoxR family ATPase [Nitrospiria bacterium]|jgi:MoxR-like ATPase
MNGRDQIQVLQDNIEQVIKGKSQAIKLSIITLLAKGHLLIEDVPGVGKTTLAHALARSLDCSFKRIQFTSDLLPSDILGVSIYHQQAHEFEFKPGPIFANIILADEINRTTPKTQSSLLEAMNDVQVTVENKTYPLPKPFMVIATQNPMEHYGTYPLPESQLDRFMMRVRIGYPNLEAEKWILMKNHSQFSLEEIPSVITNDQVLILQKEVEGVLVEESLVQYLLEIISATRQSDRLSLGASTRAAMSLFRAAQSHAFVSGRDYCIPDDIKILAPSVLSHRVIIQSFETSKNPTQEAEEIIQAILQHVAVPL